MMIHVYLVVCLCGLLSSPAFGSYPPVFCTDQDGNSYEPGQEVPDDNPCSVCTCLDDGTIECAPKDCAMSTECQNPVQNEGECCPTCLEGCIKDDIHYEFGQDVPSGNPCIFCYCTEDDGLFCIPKACDLLLPCPNPVQEEGDCCASCPDGCVNEDGVFFEVGVDVLTSEPCEFCKCSQSGEIICAWMSCMPLPCANPENVPGQCCPVCPGCFTQDGAYYDIGDTVPNPDPCYSCVCAPDRRIECEVTLCHLRSCDNQEYLPDQCCPVCPDNCVVGGVHYDYDDVVPTPDPCEFCTCTPDGISCATITCSEPPCDNPETPLGQCCAVCPDLCYTNGVYYEHGDTVPNPDPCHSCECAPDGRIKCEVTLCHLRYCDNQEYLPGVCCPVCPDNCVVDGVHYDYGAIVPTPNPCEFCTCTPDGISCPTIQCAEPPCDNPETPLGQCCAVCPDLCYTNGVYYEHDTVVPTPNPCEYCKCSSESGIMCILRDCAAPPCTNPVPVPGQCCPVCPDDCEVNNVIYNYGQVIPSSEPCEQCACEALGPVCGPVTCPPVNCIDPVHRRRQCCPICPNGPNCAYGRRLIPVGEAYSPNPRFTCSCRTEPWDPMACCKKSIPANYAAKLLRKKSTILNPILVPILEQAANP